MMQPSYIESSKELNDDFDDRILLAFLSLILKLCILIYKHRKNSGKLVSIFTVLNPDSNLFLLTLSQKR